MTKVYVLEEDRDDLIEVLSHALIIGRRGKKHVISKAQNFIRNIYTIKEDKFVKIMLGKELFEVIDKHEEIKDRKNSFD